MKYLSTIVRSQEPEHTEALLTPLFHFLTLGLLYCVIGGSFQYSNHSEEKYMEYWDNAFYCASQVMLQMSCQANVEYTGTPLCSGI